MTYYCWESDRRRLRGEADVTHEYIHMVERESPSPPRLLSLTPPLPPLKASYISANDLRSFPDLASAIQRIMNNALTLKLQK